MIRLVSAIFASTALIGWMGYLHVKMVENSVYHEEEVALIRSMKDVSRRLVDANETQDAALEQLANATGKEPARYRVGDRVYFELGNSYVCGLVSRIYFTPEKADSVPWDYCILFGPGTEGSNSVTFCIEQNNLSAATSGMGLTTADSVLNADKRWKRSASK